MDKSGIYGKTPRGQEEVDTRALKLPAKLRQLLIMVDGETDVANLTERFDQDNAVGHIIALEHMGLITLIRGTAALADGANDADGAREDLSELRQALSHLALDSLGPDASDMAMRIEDCQSRAELRAQCENCRTIITGVLGKARADKYWAQAEALLG